MKLFDFTDKEGTIGSREQNRTLRNTCFRKNRYVIAPKLAKRYQLFPPNSVNSAQHCNRDCAAFIQYHDEHKDRNPLTTVITYHLYPGPRRRQMSPSRTLHLWALELLSGGKHMVQPPTLSS